MRVMRSGNDEMPLAWATTRTINQLNYNVELYFLYCTDPLLLMQVPKVLNFVDDINKDVICIV